MEVPASIHQDLTSKFSKPTSQTQTYQNFSCQCPAGWTGVHCNRKPTDCSSGGFELCGHGTCISQNNQAGYKCLCDAGWTNENPQGPCTTDVNECAQNHPPCSTNPLVQCINVPGSYTCQHCPPGKITLHFNVVQNLIQEIPRLYWKWLLLC